MAKAAKHIIRVIIPDSHGEHIDPKAKRAFLDDLEKLRPDELIFLGDHLDCAGTFNAHQRTYTDELEESYEGDVAACVSFLDQIQERAPGALGHYLEGNHEQHVERWAARTFGSKRDADGVLSRVGPEAALGLRKRSIAYYKRSTHYHGLSIPGTIRLGKVYFTHGIAHGLKAANVHVQRFGANVVFGHCHDAQSVIIRTVTSDALGAWCPGTLARLQPLYRHTSPSTWTHGYGLQFVNCSTGTFLHINVPIYRGVSSLMECTSLLHSRGK